MYLLFQQQIMELAPAGTQCLFVSQTHLHDGDVFMQHPTLPVPASGLIRICMGTTDLI
jgi:hypothetical protein